MEISKKEMEVIHKSLDKILIWKAKSNQQREVQNLKRYLQVASKEPKTSEPSTE